MANNFYGAIGLIGGGAGFLDAIDGAGLTDLDAAFVQVFNTFHAYTLDADSGAAESSPAVIAPDTNAGTKRWILQNIHVAGINEEVIDHDALLNFVANEHINHSVVDMVAGIGISGGGDITASRTFNLDFTELDLMEGILAADLIPFTAVALGNAESVITFADFEGDLNHDNLLGFVEDEIYKYLWC